MNPGLSVCVCVWLQVLRHLLPAAGLQTQDDPGQSGGDAQRLLAHPYIHLLPSHHAKLEHHRHRRHRESPPADLGTRRPSCVFSVLLDVFWREVISEVLRKRLQGSEADEFTQRQTKRVSFLSYRHVFRLETKQKSAKAHVIQVLTLLELICSWLVWAKRGNVWHSSFSADKRSNTCVQWQLVWRCWNRDNNKNLYLKL